MSGEAREPQFNIDKEVILRSNDGITMSDSTKGLTTKANVILLSYNRPNMLRQSIRSVLDSTYDNIDLWIADDGSDFDVAELVDEFKDDRILWMQREKISPGERAKKSRIAENINSIMEDINEDDMIYYLCDDDILDPHWIARSIACIEHSPNYHIVSGDSYYFFDGDDWSKDSKPGLPLKGVVDDKMPRLWWGIGSFTHKAYCWHKENVKWYDAHYGHSIDTNFISDIWFTHQNYLMVKMPAVYRREHPGMLSAKLGRKDDDGMYYSNHTPPPLRPEMVEGWME